MVEMRGVFRTLSKPEMACSKLTPETLERRQWRLSGVFIVNFEQILYLVLFGVAIVNVEQTNAGWGQTSKMTRFEKIVNGF